METRQSTVFISIRVLLGSKHSHREGIYPSNLDADPDAVFVIHILGWVLNSDLLEDEALITYVRWQTKSSLIVMGTVELAEPTANHALSPWFPGATETNMLYPIMPSRILSRLCAF